MSKFESLTVSLPAELASSVHDAVSQGDYLSTSEIVREALDQWELARSGRTQARAELKASIEEGLSDVAADHVRPFDLDSIVREGRRLLAGHSV